MTTYNAINDINTNILAAENLIQLSGTVSDGTNPLVRDILIYRKPKFDIPFRTTSASDGTWSMTIGGNTNDNFLIISLGIDAAENSEAYDWIGG